MQLPEPLDVERTGKVLKQSWLSSQSARLLRLSGALSGNFRRLLALCASILASTSWTGAVTSMVGMDCYLLELACIIPLLEEAADQALLRLLHDVVLPLLDSLSQLAYEARDQVVSVAADPEKSAPQICLFVELGTCLCLPDPLFSCLAFEALRKLGGPHLELVHLHPLLMALLQLLKCIAAVEQLFQMLVDDFLQAPSKLRCRKMSLPSEVVCLCSLVLGRRGSQGLLVAIDSGHVLLLLLPGRAFSHHLANVNVSLSSR